MRFLKELRQLDSAATARVLDVGTPPLHRKQGNLLTSAVNVHFPPKMRDVYVESYRGWRKVAGEVGAFAGDGVG